MTVPVARDPHDATCGTDGQTWRWPVLWIGLLTVALAGLALNWSWLVAAGAIPILLAALPCVVMCLLHLCSGRKNSAAS